MIRAATVEANYINNGNSISELPIISSLIQNASKSSPPAEWLNEAITRHLKNNKLVKLSGWQDRNSYYQHCLRRYNIGVPLNHGYLTRESVRLKRLESDVRLLLPQGLIRQGKVDSSILNKVIPSSILRNWPVINDSHGNKEFCFSKNTLNQIDHDIAELLLAQKEVMACRLVHGIKTGEDELHHFWSNPYGTSTGRDKPRGSCITYLPKKYRDHVFNPKAGETLVLIDYEQQEPGIAASYANDQRLINLYLSGDIYANFAVDGMARKQVKRQVLAHLYGQDKAFKTKTEQAIFACFNHYFNKVNDDLDRRASLAYEYKEMVCHDWRMSVSNHSRILSVRNWPIQTTGGVILRKACQLLDEAKLPVIAAFHDAVLLKIPTNKQNEKIQLATQLMEDASLFILQNLKLRVSVEAIYQRGTTNDK